MVPQVIVHERTDEVTTVIVALVQPQVQAGTACTAGLDEEPGFSCSVRNLSARP